MCLSEMSTLTGANPRSTGVTGSRRGRSSSHSVKDVRRVAQVVWSLEDVPEAHQVPNRERGGHDPQRIRIGARVVPGQSSSRGIWVHGARPRGWARQGGPQRTRIGAS